MPTPSRSILVCATPRSGSYLLCEAIRLTGRAGSPEEYLWRPNAERFARDWGIYVDAPHAYRDALYDRATGSDGVFATKVMWGYAGTAGRILAGGEWDSCDDDGSHPDADCLLGVPAPLFVHMRRRDVVSQAVSYSRAVKADAWARLADGTEVPGAMPVLDDGVRQSRPARAVTAADYDYHHIRHFHDEVTRHNSGWEDFFERHGITPVQVDYERLVEAYEEVALEILRAAGQPCDEVQFGERRMRKQRDHVSRRWLLRYREDAVAEAIARESVDA